MESFTTCELNSDKLNMLAQSLKHLHCLECPVKQQCQNRAKDDNDYYLTPTLCYQLRVELFKTSANHEYAFK